MCSSHDYSVSSSFDESGSTDCACSVSSVGSAARERTEEHPGTAEPTGGALFIQNRVKDCDRTDGGKKEKPPEPNLLDKPYKIVRCSCRCRFCSDCAVGIGLSIREKLIPTVSKWSGMLMLTLTINPKHFQDPEDAYRFVKSRRLVSRLVRELFRKAVLKSKKYFCVFEVQKSGNPHWHVLVEASFVPHHILNEIWNRWGPGEEHTKENPKLGFTWISKDDFKSPKHAAEYATKYLVKQPEEGWPDWVLDYNGQIHRCDRSRRLFDHLKIEKKIKYSHCETCFCEDCREQIEPVTPCECCACEEARSEVEKLEFADEEPKKERKSRTIRERLKDCGNSTVVLRRLVEQVRPGQHKCKYICTLDEPFDVTCQRLAQSPASQLFLDQADLDKLFSVDRDRQREAKNYEWKP